MTTTRSAHMGSSRKLILAFDIGTTYSGVSYVLIEPGLVSEIKPVIRYSLPSRSSSERLTLLRRFLNHAIESSKISSTLFYDHDGSFRGVKGTVDDDEAKNLHELRW